MEQKNELIDDESITLSEEQESINQLVLSLLGLYPGNRYTVEREAYGNTPLTSLTIFSRMKPDFNSKLLIKLINCIAKSKNKELERILKISPERMAQKVTFTHDNQYFQDLSPFEFALWTKKFDVIDLMIKVLSSDKNGLEIASVLKDQYDKYHGVTYTRNNKTITEQYFDDRIIRPSTILAIGMALMWFSFSTLGGVTFFAGLYAMHQEMMDNIVTYSNYLDIPLKLAHLSDETEAIGKEIATQNKEF